MNQNQNHDIRCSVKNCLYFKDNFCTADRIQVDNQYGSLSNNSDETICVTFKPKDS